MLSEQISHGLRKLAKSAYRIGTVIFALLVLYAAILAVTGASDATRLVAELVHDLGPVLSVAWVVGIVADFVASLMETPPTRRRP